MKPDMPAIHDLSFPVDDNEKSGAVTNRFTSFNRKRGTSMVDTYTLSSLLFYQAPLLCVIICAYVFFTIKKNGLTSKQYTLIRYLTIGCVLAMSGEVVCGMILYGFMKMDISYYVLFINITYTCLLGNTFLFGEFCIAGLNHPEKRLCILFRSVCAAALLVIFARFVLIDTHLFTYYDNNGDVAFGALDDLQTWGCVAADIITLILCAIKCADRKEYINKEKNRKLLVTCILVTVALILYAFTYLPYVIWMAQLLAILYIFIGSQSMMIYNDELTSLYNRRKMLVDLRDYARGREGIMDIGRESTEWGYIFCDINSFKEINDVYGHKEGDQALIIVASVLDAIAKKNDATAYRIGGDEFAILAGSSDNEKLQNICNDVDSKIRDRRNKENLKYQLSVSCGYAAYGENSMTDIQDIIERADQKMYENKREIKSSL